MATTAELITKCKIGLQLDPLSTDLDLLLEQKILAVKVFMTNAGVSQTQIDSDLGVGTIVLGVSDLWDLQGGKPEFSSLFMLFVSQLKYISLTESGTA